MDFHIGSFVVNRKDKSDGLLVLNCDDIGIMVLQNDYVNGNIKI